jgi:dihydrofolate synthase/folylpolyglutamate synthase
MLNPSIHYFDSWLLADLPYNPRATAATDIASELTVLSSDVSFTINDTVEQGLKAAQNIMLTGDLLVIFGSFFTVAEALALLQSHHLNERDVTASRC